MRNHKKGDGNEKNQPFIDSLHTCDAVWLQPFRYQYNEDCRLFAAPRFGKVNVKNGVAEVLAMETMSAMPIEDKVAMSLVAVPRSGITAIQTGDEIIPVNKIR